MLNKAFGIIFLLCCWNCHYSNTYKSNMNLYKTSHDIYVNTDLLWDFSNADIHMDGLDENDYLEWMLDGLENKTSYAIYKEINKIDKKVLSGDINKKELYISLKREIESLGYESNCWRNWVCDTLYSERVVFLSTFKFNLSFSFRGTFKIYENLIYIKYGYINWDQEFYFIITPKACIWGQVNK